MHTPRDLLLSMLWSASWLEGAVSCLREVDEKSKVFALCLLFSCESDSLSSRLLSSLCSGISAVSTSPADRSPAHLTSIPLRAQNCSALLTFGQPYQRKGQRGEPAADGVRFLLRAERLAPVRWTVSFAFVPLDRCGSEDQLPPHQKCYARTLRWKPFARTSPVLTQVV
ncbi:MAG: hypothetical protein RI897_3437 [Verrucomicrobiota bacterium]